MRCTSSDQRRKSHLTTLILRNTLKRIGLGGVLVFVVTLVGIVFYTRASAPTRVYAATSSTLNFQARLLSGSGAIVGDGDYSIVFNLYSAPTGGVSQWTETQSVQVKAGYLTVNLGKNTPFPGTIDWSQEQYLTMNVSGDGEMDPRLKLTAVPYAFRAARADTLTITGGTITGDGLVQLAPGSLQTVSSAVSGLRVNQTGSGGLLQLATGGVDKFTIDNGGSGSLAGGLTVAGGSVVVGTVTQPGTLTLNDGSSGSSLLEASASGLRITSGGSISVGTVDTTGTLFVLDSKTNATDPAGTNGAMYYNAAAGKFRCYQSGQWQDCINGSNYNATASFVSGLANVPGTATASIAEMLLFTSATAVSNAAGVTGFTAPAAGSFRTCLVKNNAAITAGTLSLRWRVNGASVGAGACLMDATTSRQSATSLDPGVVTFNAGDTIGVAFDSTGLTPVTNDFTIYWTVEYNSSIVGGGGSGTTTLQAAYDNSGANELTLDAIRGGLSILDNATPLAGNLFEIKNNAGSTTYFGVGSAGATSANTLTISSGGLVATGNSTINGTLDGLTGLEVTGGVTIDGALGGLTGLTLVSGGIDLTNSGITNIGTLSGVNSISGAGALSIASGGSGSLTLASGSGVVLLDANTLRRDAVGSTSIELNDTADTTLTITNPNGGAVANLSIEGAISANSFNGNGSGLTNLNASQISSGTLSDDRLSANVALLDAIQTFTARQTFSGGLVLGSGSATAGALRWSGSDFEGYDGAGWVSLTAGGGSGALSAQIIQAYDTTGGTDLNTASPTALPWDAETKKDTGFTHSNVTNATRVYLDDAGWYKVSYHISGENQNATQNNVFCQVRLNGTTYSTPGGSYSYARDTADGLSTNASTAYIQTAASNEYVEVVCSQAGTAGSQLAIADQSWLIVERTESPTAGPSNAFTQGGNSFGAAATLGTMDAYGLTIITGGNAALTLATDGSAVFADGVTTTGGVSILSGGLDLNSGGVVDAGALAGVTSLAGSGGLTISSGGSGDLSLDAASNKLIIAANDTIMQRTAAGAYTIDLVDSGATTLSINNSGTGAASLNLVDGNLQLNGTSILSSGAALSNLTGISSSGTVALSSLSGGGLVKAASGTGNLSLATGGTDYELPLTFGNGLTRTSNSVALGGNLSGATDIGLNSNALTISGSGGSVFTAFAAGGIEVKADSTAAMAIKGTGGTSYLTVSTSGSFLQVGSSTADAVAVLSILDSYNNATDPSGTDGASYYNTASSKARCYEDGYWTDCNTTGVLGETTLGAANATIDVTLAKTYESLECRLETKGRSGAGLVTLRFNNVSTAATYSWNSYFIIGTATADGQSSSDNKISLTSTTSSTLPFSASLKITNFSDTRKSVDWTGVSSAAIGTNVQRYSGVGVMDLTTGPITSVQFISSVGTFNAGSHAWCEGRNVR